MMSTKPPSTMVGARTQPSREQRMRDLDEEIARFTAAGDHRKAQNARSTKEGWKDFWELQDAEARAESQPTSTRSGGPELTHNGKTYAEMSNVERAALYQQDREAFDRLRAASQLGKR